MIKENDIVQIKSGERVIRIKDPIRIGSGYSFPKHTPRYNVKTLFIVKGVYMRRKDIIDFMRLEDVSRRPYGASVDNLSKIIDKDIIKKFMKEYIARMI